MHLQVTAGAKFAYGFSKVAATVFTVALIPLDTNFYRFDLWLMKVVTAVINSLGKDIGIKEYIYLIIISV